MAWQAWVLIGIDVLLGAASVMSIGEVRQPTTPAIGLGSVILAGIMAGLTVSLAKA